MRNSGRSPAERVLVLQTPQKLQDRKGTVATVTERSMVPSVTVPQLWVMSPFLDTPGCQAV